MEQHVEYHFDVFFLRVFACILQNESFSSNLDFNPTKIHEIRSQRDELKKNRWKKFVKSFLKNEIITTVHKENLPERLRKNVIFLH